MDDPFDFGDTTLADVPIIEQKRINHNIAAKRSRDRRVAEQGIDAVREKKRVSNYRSRIKLNNENPGREYKRRIFYEMTTSAKRRGLEFNIKPEDIDWVTHCPGFKTKLDYTTVDRSKVDSYHIPSPDRLDNSKGYIRGNVFIVSDRLNRLKNNMTPNEADIVARYTRYGPNGPKSRILTFIPGPGDDNVISLEQMKDLIAHLRKKTG
jgi:hypothetical protein